MLMLTRYPGESIEVGHEITITVLSVKGNQVRIGVKAPREMCVNREERPGSENARCNCGSRTEADSSST